MEEELSELTEESLYCDSINYSSNSWCIDTKLINRNSVLYHKIVNDSLSFYFINPYKTIKSDIGFGSVVIVPDDSNSNEWYPCFAHAIDARYIDGGKLLPGAILPLLLYHAICNDRLYPGRVMTIDQDFDGDVEFHDDQNEVVLVIGTPDDVIHIHGNITTKSLVVLGCTLIVDGDIHASDHIYAYCLGLKANSITGNEDAICASLFDIAQPYDVGPHSTLAMDPESNPKIGLKDVLNDHSKIVFQCLASAGWISTELSDRCTKKANLNKILKAARLKSNLIENLFKQEDEKQAAPEPEPEQDVWSEQAMEVIQWLQDPATSFSDLRQFAMVGRGGLEIPPNDPALQEDFRFQLMGALMDPASRNKLEKAWQMCGKLVDHRSSSSKAALPPSQPAAKPVSTDDFYEVDDDQ